MFNKDLFVNHSTLEDLVIYGDHESKQQINSDGRQLL
jgi:hypothetical protein